MNIKPMVSQFSIGADPEMFLVGADGEFQSSIDLLGGSKDNPRPLPHCMVQEDNVMAELNINVSRTREQFIENVGLAIRDLEDLVNPYNLSIAKCATATFKKEKMFDPRCFRFGCDLKRKRCLILVVSVSDVIPIMVTRQRLWMFQRFLDIPAMLVAMFILDMIAIWCALRQWLIIWTQLLVYSLWWLIVTDSVSVSTARLLAIVPSLMVLSIVLRPTSGYSRLNL